MAVLPITQYVADMPAATLSIVSVRWVDMIATGSPAYQKPK